MSTAVARSSSSRIESLAVSAYTIPTDFPESDGTIEWDKTTIVVVRLRCGNTVGIGYTYADVSTAKLIDSLLRPLIERADAMDTIARWMVMRHAVRNLGGLGIAAMAISAVDIALWDLKAKILGLPLVKLIGSARPSIAVYGSGGFTSYSLNQLQKQLGAWAGSGIRMVKMKIGRNPKKDLERVQAARQAIGEDVRLFVDANGAYSRKQALDMAEQFQNAGVSWFEEPVSSDDLEGLRLLRDTCPATMEIAAGEYGYDANYFRRMLDAGAVDVLQVDATRCGGVTGFLQASALCIARSMPLSAHTAPMIHMPLCCAVPQAVHLEYFHDHVRIENMLFEGTQQPIDGELSPDLMRPGLGLEFRSADAEQYVAT